MNIELDPNEVSLHLYELGYRNITQSQLEEFIRDLKRLIKYDTKKKKIVPQLAQHGEDSGSSTLPNTTDESVLPSPPPSHLHQPPSFQRPHSRMQGAGAQEESSSSSEYGVAATQSRSRRVLRECTKLHHERPTGPGSHTAASSLKIHPPVLAPRPSKSCEENWSKEREQSVKSAKSKENVAPPRPKSSFIRTWQLTGQPRPGSAGQRCDPVSLYHQYQQYWQQQKLPGENSHSELRWATRERLLGQDPQPRPLSQASSRTSVSRHQKRL